MKKGKGIFKIVSIFTSFIFFLLLSTSSVKAIYNVELNKVLEYKADRSSDTLTMSVQYQYGIKDLEIFICNLNTGEQTCAPTAASGVTTGTTSTKTIYVDENLKEGKFTINRYNDLATYTNGVGYKNPYYGVRLSEYVDIYDSEGKLKNDYTIMVKASFCTTRNSAKDGCLSWTDKRVVFIDTFNLQSGLTNSSELNTTIFRILNITNSIVIPVLWLVLGVLLVVRGIMLAIDIVKASDEPDVRKKKISGMIWLVVGVLVGYVVTISARVVMDMFGYGGYF